MLSSVKVPAIMHLKLIGVEDTSQIIQNMDGTSEPLAMFTVHACQVKWT